MLFGLLSQQRLRTTAARLPQRTTLRTAHLQAMTVSNNALSTSLGALNDHKASLYLSFSPECPPYAEVAVFNHLTSTSNKSQSILRLGLERDLLSKNASLIIPAGSPFSEDRVTLQGKPTILRFLARQFSEPASKFYDGLPLDKQSSIDDLLDLHRSLAVSGSSSAAKTIPQVPTSSTLGDILVWDLIKKTKDVPADAKTWASQLESQLPALSQSVTMVNKVLDTAHVLDAYRFPIVRQLSALTGVSEDVVFPMLENKFPKDSTLSDFSLAVPRLKLAGNPAEIAKNLAEKYVKDEFLAEVKAMGVFLKFYLRPDQFRNALIPKVLTQAETYGQNSSGFGKVAVVEFSSPNIAKPFHVGHLRSTILGNFIQKTLNASGWATVSINYLGDWGKQYGLLAVGYNKYGKEDQLLADPIRHLFDVYVKINQDAEADPTIHDEARSYFGRMEDGDGVALGLWQRFMDLSIVKYREIYGRVNVSFDVYSGESKYPAKGMKDVGGVYYKMKELGLLKPSDGAQVVDLNEFKLGTTVIEKRDGGGMLYITRDIAAAIERQKIYKFDNMFYVVGNQQEHHFKQLFKILELMGMPWAERCQHVSFGMIKSKDGMMSTRKGKVVFLEDILNHVQESMLEVMKKNEVKFKQIAEPVAVSDLVGITAIMVQDMSSRRIKDYEFDWDRMLAFEGDTGPYLQYAHARLRSIERMAGFDVDASTDLSLLTEPSAISLLDVIAIYPDVVREVSLSLEPCNTVSYAFRLAHAVMVALENLYVLNQPREIAAARLAMYKAARITMGNALRSLGIIPLERM